MKKLSYLFTGVLIVLLACCTGKEELGSQKDSLTAIVMKDSLASDSAKATPETGNFTGSYIYSSPGGQGYFYYKMELIQNGKNIKGDFFAGNYLVQLTDGSYVNPAATLSGKIEGVAHSNSYATIGLPMLKEGDRADSTYDFPDVNMVFETDANEDYVMVCTRNADSFYSIIKGDTIVWEKEKGVK